MKGPHWSVAADPFERFREEHFSVVHEGRHRLNLSGSNEVSVHGALDLLRSHAS